MLAAFALAFICFASASAFCFWVVLLFFLLLLLRPALVFASAFATANLQLEALQVLLQEAALFTALLAALLAVARVYRACVAASGQLPILRWLQ